MTFATSGSRTTSEQKLLYLMNHYSPTGSSHFSHVLALLTEMANQGTKILLVVERADAVPNVRHPDIEVVCLPRTLAGARRWFALVRTVSRATERGYRTVFVRISTWSALAAIAATRGGRGRVFFWQSGTTIEFDRAQPWGRLKLEWFLRSWLPSRLAWRLCDRFVTGPSTMVDYFATTGGVDRRKIRLLANDVDHRRFAWSDEERAVIRRSLRQRLDLPASSTILLFVHRLSPVRRTLDYLPLALEQARRSGVLDGTCLVVVGGGPDLPELRRRCEAGDLLDHVRFLGELPNMGIEEIYAAADVFVQPTHAEGFPRVLLEAMVAGLPVVTTDAGGSGEILGPLQQAFVTPKDQPEEFGRALASLLRDRARWAALARENRETACRYDTPPVARMYREVLFSE